MEKPLSHRTLYSLDFFVTAITSFSLVFASLYFFRLGFSYEEILAGAPVWFLTAALTSLIISRHRPFSLVRAGLAIMFGELMLVGFMDKSFSMMIYFFMMHGVFMTLFYTSINTQFLAGLDSGEEVLDERMNYVAFPLIAAFAPIFGGLAIHHLGFRILFLLSGAGVLGLLVETGFIGGGRVFDFSFHNTRQHLAGLRPLIVLEGFWQGVEWTCIPLITFYFISSGLKYGAFLGYIGFAGLLSAFILSRSADNKSEKNAIAYLSLILLSIVTFTSYFAKSKSAWIVIRALAGFLIAVFRPYSLAIIVDWSKTVKESMVARELYLNVGRAGGAAVTLILFVYTGSLYSSLLVSGIVFALYPALVERNGLEPRLFHPKREIERSLQQMSD